MNSVKRRVFESAQRMGLFQVSRKLTAQSLRILCYHGTTLKDESAFRPQLFIDPGTFEERLAYLKAEGYPVLPLDEAVRRLAEQSLPPGATVITIDDGFFSTYQSALPALRRHGFPATVYVTSYYVQKGRPVFRLAVQYLFWATRVASLRKDVLGLQGHAGEVRWTSEAEKDAACWSIIDHAETRCTEEERSQVLERLAEQLRVDLAALVQSRAVSLMTPEELQEAARSGVDIQLHTHRHRFPTAEPLARKELQDNRAFLEPLVGKPLHHFCYPSGLYEPRQFPWLRTLGVHSATTCEPGFNSAGSEPLALRRFLDGSNITQLEFEAELSGFSELLRRGRTTVKSLGRRRRAPASEAGAELTPG